MRLEVIVSRLDSIHRMALRAYIDHGKLPKLQVVRGLVELKLIGPGPHFLLLPRVVEVVAACERERARRHTSSPSDIERAIRARKEPAIL